MYKNAITAALALFLAAPFYSNAQNTVDQVNNTADKVSSTVDKIGGLFKKKNKNRKDTTTSTQTTGPNITINSSYDFVPGNTVLFEDDFDSTAQGAFPARWTTNSGGEVVTLQQYPGKWLSISNDGFYIPKLKGGLPKDFTVEFDLIIANGNTTNHTLFVDFEDALNGNFDPYPSNPYLQFRMYSGGSAYVESKAKSLDTHVDSREYNGGGKINHFAFRKQGERLQVYINHEKTFDVNRAFEGGRTYSTFKFGSNFSSPAHILVSNFKLTSL